MVEHLPTFHELRAAPAPEGIRTIDLRFAATEGVVAAYLLTGDNELALIETGPTSTRGNLEAGLTAAGFGLGEVSRVIVTHIHLDHAGAAGGILRDCPNARLSVHPAGLPHLVDPSRLVASATRIYGDRMDELWGPIAPAPEDRIDAVRDGQSLRAGGRDLRVIFTPGHARHHLALFDETTGTLFSGDAGGVRIQGTRFAVPPTPPPEFDIDAWQTSIKAMLAVRPARLALTHFGLFDDVQGHLKQLSQGLIDVTRIARETSTAADDTSHLITRLLEYQASGLGESLSDGVMLRLELANPAFMGAMGLQRFLRKRAERGE